MSAIFTDLWQMAFLAKAGIGKKAGHKKMWFHANSCYTLKRANSCLFRAILVRLTASYAESHIFERKGGCQPIRINGDFL